MAGVEEVTKSIFSKPYCGNDSFLHGLGQPGAGVDAHDAVVEHVGLGRELVKGCDVGILVYGNGQLGVVVPGAQFDCILSPYFFSCSAWVSGSQTSMAMSKSPVAMPEKTGETSALVSVTS